MKILNFCAVLSLLISMTMVSGDTSGVNPLSITFNQSEKFLDTEHNAYHMELDLYKNDGSILFGTYERLVTTDGMTRSNLATVSRSYITSFIQPNSTHVILVARNRNCIKVLNRESNQLRMFAGQWSIRGFVDGRLGTGLLHEPCTIQFDVHNPGRLLVTDHLNNALRSVDLHTGELGTVVNLNFRNPNGMMWVNNKLLVTNNHYISEVIWFNNGTVTNSVIAGSTAIGYVDGSFSAARFENPHEIVKVGQDLYLMADYSSNKRLRLLNMETKRVGPVCANDESPCVTGSQLPARPVSLLRLGSDLLVGTSDGIYRFPMFPVMRTVVFLAEYETSCVPLRNNRTRELLQSLLQQRQSQLQQICDRDCIMSSPWFTCNENLLTVYWPTEKVFIVDALTTPSALTTLLEERLRQNPKMCTEIVIISQSLLLVEPKKNSKGESLQITLSFSSYNKTLAYDTEQDTSVPNHGTTKLVKQAFTFTIIMLLCIIV